MSSRKRGNVFRGGPGRRGSGAGDCADCDLNFEISDTEDFVNNSATNSAETLHEQRMFASLWN